MAANIQKINVKNVAKYVFLPGIVPRAREFAGEGFGFLAMLFASVFAAVRILPDGHPFLNPANTGKYSIRQVLAAAANNIEVNRRNIDQIAVFVAIITALILLFLQFIFLLLGIFSGAAFAGSGTVTWTSIFVTEYPQVDIAFLMLDYVFGIPSLSAGGGGAVAFFGSNALMASGGPTPFHQGMHALFNFYNLALLLVGALIFIYYIIVVVIETAQTGAPFGRRFSKLYAPFRLVIAVGLLVPFGYGFNASQYITLYAAKLGSSLATNGWLLFNSNLSNPLGVENKSLVARPRFPPSDELLYFASVYHACREMYEIWAPVRYLQPNEGTCINAYIVQNSNAIALVPNDRDACKGTAGGGGGKATYTYADAKRDFTRGDIEIILGEYDPDKHQEYAGAVRPYCGKMTVSLGHDNPSIHKYVKGEAESGPGTWGDQDGQYGIRAIESIYFDMIKEMLRIPGQSDKNTTLNLMTASNNQNKNPFSALGERAARGTVPTCKIKGMPGCTHDACHASDALKDSTTCGKMGWTPPAEVFQNAIDESRVRRELKIHNAYIEFRNGLNLKIMEDLKRRGWGGAGIWYNHIADINGAFTGALYAAPSVRKWPELMEFVKSQRQAQDKAIASCDIFDPNLSSGKQVEFPNPNNIDLAKAMNAAYKYFNCEKPNQDNSVPPKGLPPGSVGTEMSKIGGGCGQAYGRSPIGNATKGVSSNIFIDFISVVFGLNGLFDIRSCSAIDPTTGESLVHPLAQLTTVGKALVENAIRSMAMALGAAFGGGMVGMLSSSLGAAANAASGMFVGVATIGLAAGFILYYILPFLPFIYFFFAVASWVKSIFEAMVGAPLWALAHLRIDGDGLPGSSAMSGYFLIFEIFIRPIVIIFGLIGGMAIFGAMAAMLNNLFDLVTSNITGAHVDGTTASVTLGAVESFRRSAIDQLFFTIMYAVLLYMMASSSFKMIDTVPKYVMRWMNSRVSTFNDNKGDPAGSLTGYAAITGSEITGRLFSGGRDAASGLGSAVGAVAKTMTSGGAKPGGGVQ